MANRKPFKLNNVLVFYNAGQVVFSFVMLWEVGRFCFSGVERGGGTKNANLALGVSRGRAISAVVNNRSFIGTLQNVNEFQRPKKVTAV